MRRFVVFDRKHDPLFDLDERIVSAVRTEKLKGEHSLTIETTQPLEEGMRILVRDGTLKWREWVVDEPDEHHTEEGMVGTYGCTWSMQYDLASKDGGELWPGTYSPIAADAALSMVLATQTTWEVGYVTVGGTNGTSLYDGSVWDYLGTLQEVWGGEMEPRIVVDGNGVTHRYVDWHAHVGQTEATRRFDFGEDCTSIRRKVAPGPRFCRVVPRGGRDAQDADGVRYSDRCGVEEEPRRVDGDFVHDANSKYVRDTVAEQLFRTKDRFGNWHYPEKVVCYDLDLQGDQEELLNKAMAEVADHTRPKTTYEADVLQFAAAGLDPHGVQLGDEVQIVDRAFGDAPLRLQARVVEMTVNELDDTDVQLVIGEPMASLDSAFKSLSKSIADADGRAREIQAGGTLVYLQHLIENLNAEINADGGYVYVTNGDGLLTYDRAVSDPTVGSEATKVVEIKGGSIRIANSRTSGGDWDWKTVFVSGHVAAELVTAAHITAGYIGNAGAGSYWNLDTNEFRIATGAQIGSTTAGALVSDTATAKANAAQALSDASDARKVATNYLTFNSTNGLDVGYSSTNVKTRINGSGMEVFDANNVSSAKFTSDEARIGRADRGHAVMKTDSLALVGADGVPRFQSVIDGANAAALTSVGVGRNMGNFGTLVINELASMQSGRYIILHGYFTDTNETIYWVCTKGTAESGRLDPDVGNTVSYDGNKTFTFSYESGYMSKGYPYITSCDYEMRIVSSYATIGTCADAGRRKAYSVVAGQGLYALNDAQLSFGKYNTHTTGLLLQGGYSSSPTSRRDRLRLTTSGNLWIDGTLTQNSDRRLKEHHAYLGEDACDFIRALRPALYTKDGARHVGFYAQDVQAAEPKEWDTETVTAQHTDESLDFDPLTLDYNALIAPLVAYTQQLERRIDQQQQQIDALTRRLDALEGGA